jgi:LAS superfamily LD-carboxypeptidase LdcB
VPAEEPAGPGPFNPVPVERPGGGRIGDKRAPAPEDIVVVDGFERAVPLHRLAAEAWAALTAAARADGHAAPLLLPVSGYRTVDEQAWLWDGALAKYGDPEVACRWVARPGTSAHQSGRAVDCHLGDPIESEYAEAIRQTPAFHWLVTHAEGFGFYPYDQEPWHWEYNPPWPVSGDAGE